MYVCVCVCVSVFRQIYTDREVDFCTWKDIISK